MMVEAAARTRYTEAWQLDQYGTESPGERYISAFLDMAPWPVHARPGHAPTTILDAGCGSGKAAVRLAEQGFDVYCCDLVADGLVEAAKHLPFQSVCLWHPFFLGVFDHVYCCDVLQDIPTPFVMLTVVRLLAAARRSVFLSINMTPDVIGPMLGTSLQHTLQPFTTWRDQLREVGTLIEARDLIHTGLFLLEPRR